MKFQARLVGALGVLLFILSVVLIGNELRAQRQDITEVQHDLAITRCASVERIDKDLIKLIPKACPKEVVPDNGNNSQQGLAGGHPAPATPQPAAPEPLGLQGAADTLCLLTSGLGLPLCLDLRGNGN